MSETESRDAEIDNKYKILKDQYNSLDLQWDILSEKLETKNRQFIALLAEMNEKENKIKKLECVERDHKNYRLKSEREMENFKVQRYN